MNDGSKKKTTTINEAYKVFDKANHCFYTWCYYFSYLVDQLMHRRL